MPWPPVSGLDTEFLGRNGLGQDDAGSLIPISANGRRNKSDIYFSETDSAGSFPGSKGAIHIDMENESGHREAPYIVFYIISNSDTTVNSNK